MSDPLLRHGHRSTYNNYGCRCDACREANRLYHYSLMEDLATREPRVHGSVSTYRNWSCRCAACLEAHRGAMQRYWTKRRKDEGQT